MSVPVVTSPAIQAANDAQALIHENIDANKSFRVEAGAGAGKTYSLVEALKYITGKRGDDLIRQGQQIACITYTNVATDEIATRTDQHPAIRAATIHAFCWSLIQGFQTKLQNLVEGLADWQEKLAEIGGKAGSRKIGYDEAGRRKVFDDSLSLHHDDVLALTIAMLEEEKFRRIFKARYPVVFVDEYQDTHSEVAAALQKHFIENDNSMLLGFFGDSWQKIYGEGCGAIEHQNLAVIGKGANFRSAPVIVDCLNRMRPSLQQKVRDPSDVGSVAIFHTNDWVGTRMTGQHQKGDLPADASREYLGRLKTKLGSEGWDMSPGKTKVLMLTHKVLANEQGYRNLADVFKYTDAYVKKENAYIAFFVDVIEPACRAYEQKQFGEMFRALNIRTPKVQSHTDKTAWAKDMQELIAVRKSGTIGEVIDLLARTKRPRLSEAVEAREKDLKAVQKGEPGDDEYLEMLRNLKAIRYEEVINLTDFINENTPFSTQHGVKGAEFENVLVIFSRGWNRYDFNSFLEQGRNPPTDPKKLESFERNRNLFYVACSRPKKRLAALFTHQLSPQAMETLEAWFGSSSVHSMGTL